MCCIGSDISELPVLAINTIGNQCGVRGIRPERDSDVFTCEAELQARGSAEKLVSGSIKSIESR
jgi:hypothetical protein